MRELLPFSMEFVHGTHELAALLEEAFPVAKSCDHPNSIGVSWNNSNLGLGHVLPADAGSYYRLYQDRTNEHVDMNSSDRLSNLSVFDTMSNLEQALIGGRTRYGRRPASAFVLRPNSLIQILDAWQDLAPAAILTIDGRLSGHDALREAEDVSFRFSRILAPIDGRYQVAS